MSDPLDQAHVNWAQNLFRTLTDGGQWGVPRSGLIFTKGGTRMILTGRALWSPDLGGSATDWLKYQRDDYHLIRAHFEAGQISVEDETNLVNPPA